ncbi:MAG: undecaprenyl-diphosphate phosphatase [Clostridia bacterium]|nr:undecaprenyl-diphosphate phosphatase [Clostridia bacterium]
MEFLKALLFGILEGVTEWLPVSSTGHIILLDRFLRLNVGGEISPAFAAAFSELFQVVIQLGAVAAVALKCFDRISPFSQGKTEEERRYTISLYGKLVLSGIPAALLGLIGDRIVEHFTGKDIDAWLYNGTTVAVMLILYGVFFLVPERYLPRVGDPVTEIHGVSAGKAFFIGCFQALSIIPGTSRSGATILGGMLLGLSRSVAAEYSFLLAIPTMAGASLLKSVGFVSFISENGVEVPFEAYAVLFVGAAVAFLVSCFVLDFLVDFVKKHSFAPFGVYRILLGAAVLIGCRR